MTWNGFALIVRATLPSLGRLGPLKRQLYGVYKIGTMNPDFWRHSARFWYIMGILENNLNAVKNFQNVPNLAGCLFPFIKIDFRSFLSIFSIFKKMFIFVHFVHSEHQEPGRGSILALGHSYYLYLPCRTTG